MTIWLTVVVFMAAHHVPWRDEVTALSLAMDAASPRALFENLQFDAGHPILWHLLLSVAYHIYPTPVVLKTLSVAVAFAAVAIFLFRAPFPLWFRCLFIFCGLPFFEYSVVARNYGISMFLLFAFAWAYGRPQRNPWMLGSILFLLANTNLHSLGFVALLAGLWAWDFGAGRDKVKQVVPGAGVALLGIAFALFTIIQTSEGTVARSGDPLGSGPQAERATTRLLRAGSVYDAVKLAGWDFRDVIGMNAVFGKFPRGSVGRAAVHLGANAILLLAVVGLIGRPALAAAAVASLLGLSLLFEAVYSGGYRHQGLWLVFLLALYWLAEIRRDPLAWPRAAVPLRRLSLFVVLPVLFALNCVHAVQAGVEDWRRPYSSSRDLAALLNGRDDLKQAVIIGQPDHVLSALPYFLQNRLYLMGLGQYGRTASLSISQKPEVSLGDLLDTAQRLKAQTGNPVVILISPVLNRSRSDRKHPFGYRFSWNETQLDRLRSEAIHLASLRRAFMDENYDVYLVR